MNEFNNIVLFSNFDYEDAFIGVSNDDRAIYDWEKMVAYLVDKQGMSEEEAVDWIDYNTIRALAYYDKAPIIMYPYTLEDIRE